MIKNQTVLEIIKNERVYQLHLSSESPLGECFDVLSEMRSFILERINASAQDAKTDEADK